jgi:hypothetical protein
MWRDVGVTPRFVIGTALHGEFAASFAPDHFPQISGGRA